MAEQLFLEPLDVLYLRGNRLFGDPGAHGEALMPPWPSVAAGAIRSRILADRKVDTQSFARNQPPEDSTVRAVLGTPAEPGSFRIHWFTLGRRVGDSVEPLMPLPADLVMGEDDTLRALQPVSLPAGLSCSSVTALLPVLAQEKQAKAKSGLWLNRSGMAEYLAGRLPSAENIVPSSELWKIDPRLGIALDADKRSAAQGMIYTAETVAFHRQGKDLETGRVTFDTGFFVAVEGGNGLLPTAGLVRLGGDGRGCAVASADVELPEPEWETIAQTGRFKLVLASPGLFEGGWRLPGLVEGHEWQGPDGCTARLAAACVSRSQVISGWDLAKWFPKPALRAVPTGSVYWFDGFNGAVSALRKLAEQGLWALGNYPDRQRQAEGFNNVMIAAWPREEVQP